MLNIKQAAEEIKKANAEFGYNAGPLEVANSVWYRLSVDDRFDIVEKVQSKGISIKGIDGLRACVKMLAEMIEVA
jgi:hypothetical protein